MQSDTLEERYAIKFCFRLRKMPQKRMEWLRLLFDHLAWIEHEFLSGIKDSRKAESLWGMMRGVRGVRKSIHQNWVPTGQTVNKEYYFEVLREFSKRFRRKRPALFKPGQCTSPQLHPCHRLFDQYRHQDTSSRYETIEEMKEAVTKVIDTLTHEDFDGALQKLLERYNKCNSAGGDYFEGG